jgi:hypothetical protein
MPPLSDEDRDGLRNVGLLTAQPFDPADSPREHHHTQSPGKQQIAFQKSLIFLFMIGPVCEDNLKM